MLIQRDVFVVYTCDDNADDEKEAIAWLKANARTITANVYIVDQDRWTEFLDLIDIGA